jgi:hypothetical protein
MADTNTVVRYVPTYVNQDGLRTLVLGAQGRWTWAAPEQAQAWLDAFLGGVNDPDTIAHIYGPNPRFQVRPCQCHPGHHDPVGIYFNNQEG